MSAVDVATHLSGRPGAPVVVLSNSLGSTYRMWDAQLTALEERFQVLRYDTRGHGASPVPPGPYTIDDLADDLVSALDRHDIASAHVVGLSLGGLTAMRVAIRNPERVDNLALLCTSACFAPPAPWLDRAATVRADGVAAIADAIIGRWFTADYLADERNIDTVAWYRAMIADTPAEGYAGCCEALARADVRGDLGAIKASTLAVAGADDPATPPDRLAAIVEAVPDSRLEVVADAAHLANAQQPQQITPLLIKHLEHS
ncbi:3-oxoadipate enol-lactonase [Gordonia aichiensis]